MRVTTPQYEGILKVRLCTSRLVDFHLVSSCDCISVQIVTTVQVADAFHFCLGVSLPLGECLPCDFLRLSVAVYRCLVRHRHIYRQLYRPSDSMQVTTFRSSLHCLHHLLCIRVSYRLSCISQPQYRRHEDMNHQATCPSANINKPLGISPEMCRVSQFRVITPCRDE